MSMPTEISKLVHDFLRGGDWNEKNLRIINAKDKWIEKNGSLGFKVGQVYNPAKDLFYKVVKVAPMVTFERNGELFLRKPKFIQEHDGYNKPYIEGISDSRCYATWSVKVPYENQWGCKKNISISMEDLHSF